MKRTILIFSTVLIAIGLIAIGCMNSSNSMSIQEQSGNYITEDFTSCSPTLFLDQTNQEFFYDVAPRYISIFTKTDIGKVRSMAEFDRANTIERIVLYRSVTVSILDDDYNAIQKVTGESGEFNAEQLNLFRSVPYSADILIKSEYQMKGSETGLVEEGCSTPHLTVVPEKQAEYLRGKDALLNYLKENSKQTTAIVKRGKLQPGKVRFTVTRNGNISKVKLIATSGYNSVDKTMVELITKTLGKWNSAENFKGEKVDQELVFSFGIVGC